MKVLEAINSRRAVKHFDREYVIPEVDEQQLRQALRRSPTAFNIQNWRFVVVKDSELRKKIRNAAWDQAQVTDCSLLFIMCADLKAWGKAPARYWKEAPPEVQEIIVPMIEQYYHGRDDVQQDEAMRSCGMAAQTLMLAAKELGLDSCPMDGFDFDEVARLINLPSDHVISMFVAVGKAAQEARPRGGDILDDEVFIEDRF